MAGGRRERTTAERIGAAIEDAVAGVADTAADVAGTVADAAESVTDAAGSVVSPNTPLPHSRDQLLVLHREWRRRREQAPLDSDEYRRAAEEVGRIEVEIARVERAMDPPRV